MTSQIYIFELAAYTFDCQECTSTIVKRHKHYSEWRRCVTKRYKKISLEKIFKDTDFRNKPSDRNFYSSNRHRLVETRLPLISIAAGRSSKALAAKLHSPRRFFASKRTRFSASLPTIFPPSRRACKRGNITKRHIEKSPALCVYEGFSFAFPGFFH